MNISHFANKLRCQNCGQTHSTTQWPINGDNIPFYLQTEKGKYTLSVNCPHCRKEWYIVWDNNPGEIRPIGF